jgi:ATP-dependent helicase HrpA
VVNVEGRGYPVEVRYRPPEGEGEGEGDAHDDWMASSRVRRNRAASTRGGDVLIFLPGEREIRDAHQRPRAPQVSPHRSPAAVRAPVRARPGPRVLTRPQRRIVLATNVAETSLTVPRIRYVVDPRLGARQALQPTRRSSTACTSSRSRRPAPTSARAAAAASPPALRTACIPKPDFASRRAITDPEIRRAALAA